MATKLFPIGFVCISLMLIKDARTLPKTMLLIFGNDSNEAKPETSNVPAYMIEPLHKMEEAADQVGTGGKKIAEAAVKIVDAAEKLQSLVDRKPEKITGAVDNLEALEDKKPEIETIKPVPHDTLPIFGPDGTLRKQYYVFHSTKVNFDEALLKCNSMGYRLASIENDQEFDSLTAHLWHEYDKTNRFWTSGNDLKEYSEFAWGSIGKKIPLKSSWWWEDEPNHADNGRAMEHCVELSYTDKYGQDKTKSFKLNDIWCDHQNHPICEDVANKEEPAKTETESPVGTICIYGEDGVLSKTYHILSDKAVNFKEAMEVCDLRGYKPASTENQHEFNILTAHLWKHYQKSDKFWTSGNDLEDYGEFVWGSIGKKIPLNPAWWWEGEPNHAYNGRAEEHCVELSYTDKHHSDKTKGFKLNDVWCDHQIQPICEKVNVLEEGAATVDKVQGVTTAKSAEQDKHNLKRYHILYDSQNFQEAAEKCISMGYKLTSIGSQQDFDSLNAFLLSQFNKHDRFWTSGNDLNKEKTFIWTTTGAKIPLDVPWWGEGEPNHFDYKGNPENCVELTIKDEYNEGLNQGYKLNDVSCDLHNYPICDVCATELEAAKLVSSTIATQESNESSAEKPEYHISEEESHKYNYDSGSESHGYDYDYDSDY